MSGETLFLDVAGNIGVADGEPGKIPRLYTIRVKRDSDGPFDPAGRAVLWAAGRIAVSKPRVVYIEAPPNAGWRGKTTAHTIEYLGFLAGALGGVFVSQKIPVYVTAVSTVRAWFLGQGNLPGEFAKSEAARVARALGWNPKTLDEADAAAGFHWAAGLYDKTIGPPVAHWTKRAAE